MLFRSIGKLNVTFDFFPLIGKGIKGYLSNRISLQQKIKEFSPDIIHAHYGLSGLLANLQRKVPVITTYHGCDIQARGKNLLLSKIAMQLSVYNIFVSNRIYKISNYKKQNGEIIPCGVNINHFKPIDKITARKQLKWDVNKTYVLFASAFDVPVKNSELAKKAVTLLDDAELVELKNFTRNEVQLIMNACDVLLLTSVREASPMVVKEAMLCNKPIVATNVGDIEYVFGNTDGCYLTSFDEKDCASKLEKAIKYSREIGATKGRERILELGLDNKLIAQKIVDIYNQVINKNI